MKLKGFKKSDGSIAKIYTDPTLTESDSPADAASVKAKDDLLQQGITNNANYAAGLNTRLSELENGAPSIIAPKVTEWLDANVDPTGSAVTVDSSLTIAGSAADAKKTGDELSNLKSDLSGLIDDAFDVDYGLLSVSASNFTDMRASQGWNSLVISYNEHNDGFSVYHTANYNERFCWSFPVEATKTYTITFESTSSAWLKVGVSSAKTTNEALWTEIQQNDNFYSITFTVNQNVSVYYLCFALTSGGV